MLLLILIYLFLFIIVNICSKYSDNFFDIKNLTICIISIVVSSTVSISNEHVTYKTKILNKETFIKDRFAIYLKPYNNQPFKLEYEYTKTIFSTSIKEPTVLIIKSNDLGISLADDWESSIIILPKEYKYILE